MTDTDQTLAELLTTARMQRGLTRAQLAAATRVPLTFITAIEEEDHSALPKAVFCRGFLRIIARHLQLEIVTLLSAFAVLHPTPSGSKSLLSTNDVLIDTGQRKTATRQHTKPLLLTILALVLLGGVIFYFLHQHTANTTAPNLAEREPITTAAPATPATATTPVPSLVRQHLRLQVIRPLQIEVTIDNGKQEHRMLLPQSYEFEFEQQVRLTIADMTAIKLWFNGEAVGALKRGGRQRVLIFKAATTARAEDNADHHFQH